MNKETNPDSPPPLEALADDASTISTASLTDFIDRLDRAAFRRALELRDTHFLRQVPRTES